MLMRDPDLKRLLDLPLQPDSDNIGDFQKIARRYTHHAGILLATQRSFSPRELIELLDKSFSTATASAWVGQVRWLRD
jgi:hypothetical protein